MAEREKLVYIVLDEANRPTSLGAFEDGDTIPSGTLPNNVRTAVEDVDTLNTRVDNLDTSVGDLSAAIDAIEVGAVDASVLAAAQFVTDSSGDIIDTSNAVVTLDTRVGNVETSTTNLSSYINANESAWTAGIDAGTLADLTAVSSVVSNTSGANEDIVNSYGTYSGAAVGIQYANATFDGAGSVKTNLTLKNNDITDVGNITVTGTVDGVDISDLDSYVTSLATSSEELSSVITTNTGNIATNTADISYLGAASAAWEATRVTVTNNQSDWTNAYILATDVTSLSATGFLNGSNPTLNTSLTGTGNIKIDGGVSAGPLSAAGSILSTGIIKSSTSLQSLGNIAAANNITTTGGDIVATAGDVSANGVSVTALDGRVTTAEGNITTLQGDVAPVTDLVNAFGPVSGEASGVSGAAAVFASVNGTTAVINRDFDFNSKDLSNINSLEAKGGFSLTGNITLDGTVDGVDISDLNSYVTSLATSSEELSAVITTNTGNIATNTTNITNLTTSSEELSAVITSNTGNIENLVNAFYIEDGVYYTSGFRVGSSGIPFDEATSILEHAYYGYNATKEKFELVIPPIVDDGLGVAVFTATGGINEGSFDLPITVNQAMTFSGGATLQFSGSGGSVDFGDASNISFGSQQTFTPSSNTFATRNILVGNELSSGPECVVNLEGSTIWASGSVLSAGSGCDITLRGDKFFYGPTNIYGPLGTDLDLDGNNIIDVNNVTTANSPLTLQVTGTVNAGNLNIKNTSITTGLGITGNVDIDAVGDITLSSPNTISMEADTVTLDGTGLFGLSGGAVQIEATSTYVTIDAGAYINVESTLNSSYKANNNLTLSATNDLRLESASTDIEITTPTFDTDTFGVCCTNWNTGYTKATSPGYMARANASTQNLNATNVALELSTAVTSNGSDITWSSANPTRLTIGTTGTYRITFNIYGETSVTQRANIFAQMRIDGTTFAGPIAAGGYIRVQSGHDEASVHASFLYPLTSGQYIEIVGNQAAAAGGWNTTIGTSQVSIELIH